MQVLGKIKWNPNKKLEAELSIIAAYEKSRGAKMSHGIPDRWWADVKWRCAGGHVLKTVMRRQDGRYQCIELGCVHDAMITFPEDFKGPLKHPALE